MFTRYPPTLDETTPIPIPPNTDRTQNPAVGTTFQANWPSGTSGRLFWWNDSPYGHTVAFDSQGSTANGYYVPAYHARLITPFRPVNKITYSVDAASTLSGASVAPLALLFIEYHPLDGLPGMPDQITPIAERLSNVGNTVQIPNSAANALEQDVTNPFVLTGLVATKDGSVPNQLDVTAGIAFLRQADQSLGRVAPAASLPGQFTTSAISSTYFLDLNPDGSWSFATTHSGVSNFSSIAQVTTDASGNISTVADKRQPIITLLPAMIGPLKVLAQFVAQAALAPLQAFLSSAPLSDTAVIFGSVAGDGTHRIQQYIRGSDGYGGLSGGVGGVSPASAHLYAQAAGWQIDEALAVLGAFSAKGASSLDNGALTTDGNGDLTKIGGQASVGLGVPVKVADSGRVHVTVNTLQTILSFTPTVSGVYRVSGGIAKGNATASNLTYQFTATDPDLSLTSTWAFEASGANLNGSAPFSANNIPIEPQSFHVKAGTAITIQFQDASGTANDFVSAIIERLS